MKQLNLFPNNPNSKGLIFTVGTSNRTIEELLLLLKEHDVQTVVDIRSYPKSKRFPHFDTDNLMKELKNAGIEYHWMGKLLGGFRKEGFEKYMESADYNKGVMAVEQVAKNSRIVLLCAEKLPAKCHRSSIASSLEGRGWNIVHIIDTGGSYVRYRF